MLWRILIQFLFRMSFGLSLAMFATSSKHVTSGFFRVHLWVLLGLNTFAACVVYLILDDLPSVGRLVVGPIASAIVCYVGAVMWLYELPIAGKIALAVNAALAVSTGLRIESSQSPMHLGFLIFDFLSSGLLMGTTLAAMFLGHWYLNTPTMKLEPLKKLIQGMIAIAIARGAISAFGLMGSISRGLPLETFLVGAVVLRWLAGIIGVIGLAMMARQTLKIPNTQSATGILYVAVIFVFIGELSSQLLSIRAPFPL
jgi:hypothetical protein